MALPALDREARLIGLLDKADKQLRAALMDAIAAAVGTHTLDDLEALLLAGRMEEALETAVRAGIVRFADESAAVYTAAGQSASAFLADALEVTISFNQVNERAVNFMQQERLRLIREFSAEQRRATREALVDGITRGANPREQAIAFRESIGLTRKQQRAVNNFRNMLEDNDAEVFSRKLRDKRFDRKIRRAIQNDKPLTQDEISRMTTRYKDRYIKYRSEVIARTEALRAVHSGNNEGFEQAIENGDLDKDQLKKTWNTAGDDRVRDTHELMDRQEVKWGEDFTSPSGSGLQYPGDPNAPGAETIQCRCVMTTRIDKL